MRTRIFVLAIWVFSVMAMMCVGSAWAINRGPELRGVRLGIDSNKDTYVSGEPIIVTLTITNVGTVDITDRWFAYARGFEVDLEDSSGRPVQMSVLNADKEQEITDWVYKLGPGESVKTSFDLLRGDIIGSSPCFPKLAKGVSGGAGWVSGYAVKPGTYRLRVWHDLQLTRKADGILNRLETSAMFSIREPNSEEKQALSLFETLRMAGDKAIAAYGRVWSEHPQTPYAPYAQYYAGRMLQNRGSNADAAAKYSALLTQAPDFPLAANALYFEAKAQRALGRKDKAREIAARLRKDYWNCLIQPDVPMPNRQQGSRIQLLCGELGVKD